MDMYIPDDMAGEAVSLKVIYIFCVRPLRWIFLNNVTALIIRRYNGVLRS